MPDRVVRPGLLVRYTDPAGIPRRGVAGDAVVVHPDDIARFDELNGAPEDTPAPKRRRRPPRA